MEFGRIDLPQLATGFCQCTWQVCPIGGGTSQVQQKLSALLHHLVGLPKGIFEDAASGLILWQLTSGRMESQEKPLYSLEKVVVKVSSDSCAFRYSLLQAILDALGH
jgi:hypothetical protein